MTAKEDRSGRWTLLTDHLTIRIAESTSEDITFLYQLWTNPNVMRFVGFPYGLRTSHNEIKIQLDEYAQQCGSGEFDRVLLVRRATSNELIGECKLGYPDETGLAKTDIKLLPEFQGLGYGKEVKINLVDYLFVNTECHGIQATPNQGNIASIKMQEAVGGRRVGESCYHFPDKMKPFTCDVPYYEYVVTRVEWMSRSV